MKKIIFAACAILAVASCTKNDVIESSAHMSDEVLRLSSSIASVSEQTRVSGTKWEEEDQIAVTMLNVLYDLDGNPINEAIGKRDTKYGVKGSGGAKCEFEPAAGEEPLAYPATGDVHILAYYVDEKLDVNNDDQGNSILKFNFAEQATLADFLVAQTSTLVAKRKEAVELVFEHFFTKLSVTLKAGGGYSSTDLEGAEITIQQDGIYANLEIDILKSYKRTLENNTKNTPIPMLYNSELGVFTAMHMATVIGVDSPLYILNVTLKSGDVYNVVLRYDAYNNLTGGVNNKVEVTLSKVGVELSPITIVPWDEVDQGELEGVEKDNEYSLADFGQGGFVLPASNIWTIADDKVDNATAFAGLRTALIAAEGEGRKISLYFQNLTAFPASAFIQEKNASIASLTRESIRESVPVKSITAPRVTSIGTHAFAFCKGLERLSLGYDAQAGHAYISTIGSNWVLDVDTSLIDLELGIVVDSQITISGNKLRHGNDESLTFKSIKYVDVIVTTLDAINEDALAESDIWVITSGDGSNLNAEAFENLCIAVNNAAAKGREISLVFPNLVTFPQFALVSCKLNSISGPIATTIGNAAFSACRELTSVYLPAATTIGDNVFYENYALQTLNIGYDEEKPATIESIASNWLDDANATKNITLYLGLLPSESKISVTDGNVLIIQLDSDEGDIRMRQTFAKIIQAEDSGIQ